MTLDVPTSDISRWRAVVRVLRSPMDALCCALFPASCSLCGNSLLRFTLSPVCDPCWNQLAAQNATLCHVCGEDLGIAMFSTGRVRPEQDCVCQVCRLVPPPFRRAVAYGIYEDVLRGLIHALKYDGITPVADGLGQRLASAIALLAGEAPPDMLVIPVPLHSSKQRSRGYNQVALITRAALKGLRKSHPSWRLTLACHVLTRSRATESQYGLTMRQRRLNLRGAFAVPLPERVRGRDVLLIDDIYTSGATARACSKALLEAGAASVWIATLARAQREGVAFWNPNFGNTAGALASSMEPASSLRS